MVHPGNSSTISGVSRTEAERAADWRPVNEADGPWLIFSHYWNSWHRKSSDGGACGYTGDIAQAGVFGFDRAKEYHDWPRVGGRDEAIPIARVAEQMAARLAEMTRERDTYAAAVEAIGAQARAMRAAQSKAGTADPLGIPGRNS